MRRESITITGTPERSRQLKDATIEVPEGRGAYVLIVSVKQTQHLAIGRLGKFTFVPGFYAYVGSACGHGGIRARVSHHLASIAQPHWHIDYLLGFATPIEVWYALSDRKLEQDWAETLRHSLRFQIPIPRFGASDYRRTRTTHLFYSKQRPSFRWFEAKVKEAFEPSIRPQQLALRTNSGALS
ncbi:MAG: GIY-YIG nuclease family protein [Gammaproteobacteria bacterium]